MTELYKRLSEIKTDSPYFKKDLEKAIKANKFIGRGSIKSSTHKYMVAAGNLANCGDYNNEDVVFVSAEGNRKGRLSVDLNELRVAIEANVTFVTDNNYHRSRPYNVGEREVATFLLKNGYSDGGTGIWKKTVDKI